MAFTFVSLTMINYSLDIFGLYRARRLLLLLVNRLARILMKAKLMKVRRTHETKINVVCFVQDFQTEIKREKRKSF